MRKTYALSDIPNTITHENRRTKHYNNTDENDKERRVNMESEVDTSSYEAFGTDCS